MPNLLEIRTRVRQRSDTENSTFVTDAELNQLINTSYAELYALLIRHSLQRAEITFPIAANGAADYALPADFFSVIGVYHIPSSDNSYPLERLPDKFRPGTRSEEVSTGYRLTGNRLMLYPRSTGSYELVYIPVPGLMTLDTDQMDGVLGWEEFVVVDAAIKVMHKEESNTNHLLLERQHLIDRIMDEANAVEFTTTPMIQNVYDDWRDGIDPVYTNGRRRGVWDWGWWY